MKKDTENKHRYTQSRLKHIIKSLPYAFKSIFARRDEKLIVFCAMHCVTFDSNSKFLFLHFLKNEPEYTVKFVINDDEKRAQLVKEYGDHFIDTRTAEGKNIAVKAKYWVVSWLDLPLGGMFLKFRRFVLHLGHGTPLKSIGMMEKDGKLLKKAYYRMNNTNISKSLASTDYIADIIAKCMGFSKKRVLINGQPRMDALFAEKNPVPEMSSKEFNILYAPTWRQDGGVRLFPFADFDLAKLQSFLEENGIRIFIRFHPAFEEQIPQELLTIKNVSLFSAKKYNEVMDYINNFDALITDYSSIYLDYMVLEKPIMFLPYDLEKYEGSVGFTMDYHENTPGPKPETFEEFKSNIKDFKDRPELFVEHIKELNKKLNSPYKDSCRRLAEIIKNI